METIKTHRQFKQWLLFQLMDYDIPEWGNFVAFSKSGILIIFHGYPKKEPLSWHGWRTNMRSEMLVKSRSIIDDNTIKIPESYGTWEHSRIKLR